ncbi:uncharacterized protein N7500_009380, partial [Penicillium coprophilum]|uniref:uncharacterized protein n=1 Tax=Penicillium coprophilum TaxID=36646 RepID=UPI00239596D8
RYALVTNHTINETHARSSLVVWPVIFSTSQCIGSLLYFHNETVHVSPYLIPITITLLSNGLLYVCFSTYFPNATLVDQLVFIST